jgi:hypothetical protein
MARQLKIVRVNDKMQRGYRYVLTAPIGRNFDPEALGRHRRGNASLPSNLPQSSVPGLRVLSPAGHLND